MRKKQFISALILLVVLGLISLVSRDKSFETNVAVGSKVFAAVDVDKISEITLSRKAFKAEVVLEKKDQWQVKSRYGVLADPALVRKFTDLLKSAKAVHVISYKEEDLPLFQLDEKMGAVVVEVKEEGGKKSRYLFGKSHTFSKESSGRYVYLENEKAVILLDDALSFVAAQPSIWLKKFLPYHQDIAAVTFSNSNSILWKTERLNTKMPFQMKIPKASEKTPQEINQLMSYVLQMRYMDIVPADNDFAVDQQLKKQNLMFQTFDGKIYNLNFLKIKGAQIRCRLSLVSAATSSEFAQNAVDTMQIKEELAEWHFLVPFAFYEQLLKN